MVDLIDRKELRDALYEADAVTMQGVKIINQFPAVDAVPVVRCRECVHWGDQDGKLKNSDGDLFARCKIHNFLIDGRHTGWCPTENDFCSDGERKDGDGNG